MCSGKTTVGKKLAKRIGWKFIDIDSVIERKEGMTIPRIFAEKGEEYFRNLEVQVLYETSKLKRFVIATGGGLGANPDALKFMKDSGFVVWLKVSFEEFMRRCGGKENRPLLKLSEFELKELMKRREEVYSKAHLTVNDDEGEAESKVEQILREIPFKH